MSPIKPASPAKSAISAKNSAAAAPAGPPLPDEVQQAIAAADYDKVEKLWLAHYEKSPDDLEYFENVAKAVAKADADTAAVLVEGLVDEYKKAGKWKQRLDVLHRHGRLIFKKPQELHNAALEALRKHYSDKPSLERLLDRVGLTKAVEDVPKNWAKIEKLESLLAFDVGAVVYMDGKGVGKVQEVNLALESFKVLFEGNLELRVGFNGAPKLMKPLPPGHIQRRKMEEPAELKRRAVEDPSEVLREVLLSEDRPLAGSDIKKLLQGVVSEAQWNTFWNAARKHPQVISDNAKKTYQWAKSAEHAHGSVWDSFESADPATQVTLLRREGERDPELKKRMAARLAEVAAERYKAEPGLGIEIYLNLERAGLPPGQVPFSPDRLVVEVKDLRAIFAGIKERSLREKVYLLVKDRRRDWPELLTVGFLTETDSKGLDTLSEALVAGSPSSFDAIFEQLMSQPKKSPAAFVWLLERMADRPEWLRRNPLRTLKQYLWSLTHDDFLPYRAARMVPLADAGGTIPRLLQHLEKEQAEGALDTLAKSAAIQDYQRKPLITSIQLKFPALRKEEEAPLYATQEKIDAKRAELKKIAEEEIPVNRKAIETAREMGDLRENFEYHAARARHEQLSARAGKINEELRKVKPIDFANVRENEIVIGAKVTLESPKGNLVYTILGPWDSDPEHGVLSNESEIAKGLLGQGLGETVTVGGTQYKIAKIEAHTL
jgi:transcription elongation GreA/GreB family factor